MVCTQTGLQQETDPEWHRSKVRAFQRIFLVDSSFQYISHNWLMVWNRVSELKINLIPISSAIKAYKNNSFTVLWYKICAIQNFRKNLIL